MAIRLTAILLRNTDLASSICFILDAHVALSGKLQLYLIHPLVNYTADCWHWKEELIVFIYWFKQCQAARQVCARSPWHSLMGLRQFWEHTADRQEELRYGTCYGHYYKFNMEFKVIPSSREGDTISWRRCIAFEGYTYTILLKETAAGLVITKDICTIINNQIGKLYDNK